MLSKWSMRQKALVATFFGLALITVVTASILSGRFKFQASGELGPYDNQANLTYTDSQGQSRNIQSNIVALKKITPTYSLNGAVTNESGQPAAGAKVIAMQHSYGNFVFGCSKLAETTSGSDGKYSFGVSEIPAGAYTILSVQSGDNIQYTCDFFGGADRVSVSSTAGNFNSAIKSIQKTSQPTSLDLTLKKTPKHYGHIKVYKGPALIRFAGQTSENQSTVLSDARLILRDRTTGENFFDSMSDSTGEITVEDDASTASVSDNVYIDRFIAKEGFTSTGIDGFYFNSNQTSSSLTRSYRTLMVFENINSKGAPPILRGAVKNSAGEPISNVALVLRSKLNKNFQFVTGNKAADGTFYFIKFCVNQGDADFECGNIPTGDYTLEIIPTNEYQSTFIDTVNLTEGQTKELGNIVLLLRAGSLTAPRATADALASAPAPAEVTAQTNEASELEIVKGQPALSGTLTDPQTQAPLADAVVSIKDSKNKVVASTLTDQNGQYTLRSSQTGNYKVEVKKEGYKTKTKKVSIGEGQNLTIDMAAPKEGKFMTWLKKVWAKITKKTSKK